MEKQPLQVVGTVFLNAATICVMGNYFTSIVNFTLRKSYFSFSYFYGLLLTPVFFLSIYPMFRDEINNKKNCLFISQLGFSKI